jgi:hypothetical protein
MQLAQFPTIAPVTTDSSSFFGGAIFLILVVLAVPIAGACFTAWLAGERGRQRGLWAVLGFFFGPFALLAVGLAPMQGETKDRVVPSGSLADGIRSRFSRGSSAPATEPRSPMYDEPLRDEPIDFAPPPSPPARPQPRAPSYDEPPPSRPLPVYDEPPSTIYTPPPREFEIDVDGAVYHEGTNRMFGRGRGPDGAITYFAISSRQKLDELSEALRVSRPVRALIEEDDVVPISALPPELQR